jgi:Asp-tRNA(Asn)/Glu-tRNA(Gln) amidotransferase A subunit family amidase
VEDYALFLTSAAGHDPEDACSAARALPDLSVERKSEPPCFGLIRVTLDRSAPETASHLTDVAHRFKPAGATVREVQLEDPLDTILAAHQVIMQTEVAETRAQLLKRHPYSDDPRCAHTWRREGCCRACRTCVRSGNDAELRWPWSAVSWV